MTNFEQESHNSQKIVDKENVQKVKHWEIGELFEPTQRILEQMREQIDRGEYGLIIGDDASGRVPAWIFYNFLKEIYKKKGLPPPVVRYFAGSRHLSEEEIELKSGEIAPYLKKSLQETRNKRVGEKVLVVSDTISSGVSLTPLAQALKEQGASFDIATTIIYTGESKEDKKVKNREDLQVKDLEDRLGGKIFYGDYGSEPQIYGANWFAGVEKSPEAVFSVPYTTGNDEAQEKLNEARVDASLVAQKLVEWYETGTKE